MTMFQRTLTAFLLLSFPTAARAQDVNEVLERATKEAVRKVAPSVVQILTQGGADMVVTTPKGPTFRKALGPTTGVIVSADGYVISSLFNFVNNPTTILIAIPGKGEPFVAKRVANDKSRMLTLLKIDAKGLPVPATAPKKDIHEGQFAIAVGRTLDVKRAGVPSISVGIISATGRIWGKALQTDAKISPVNYGGPIVDMKGRVQGILIPASPQADDVTAGFEWYDSGIGFAVPFEDVLAVLPKLKEGKDLHRGILGIRLKGTDLYAAEPEIGLVMSDSVAEKAGLKAGDKIVEVEGHPVTRLAQLQHLLGTRYEGDKVSLKYRRGDKVLDAKDLVLVSSLQEIGHAFLGILPLRDDPRPGVEVRYVFANSPAEKAGIKPGERIVKLGLAGGKGPLQALPGGKTGREALLDLLNVIPAGTELSIEVKDKEGKERTVKAHLDQLPGSLPGQEWRIPDKLPDPASHGKALAPPPAKGGPLKGLAKGKDEPKKEPAKAKVPAKDEEAAAKGDKTPRKDETGLKLRTTADGEHKYWTYVPKNYDPNYSYGVVVWLHPPGQNKEADAEEFAEVWQDHAIRDRLLLLIPQSESQDGWVPSEATYVVQEVEEVLKQYTVDRQRIVAHGMGVGGQMALHLGMNYRSLFRGAATVGAVPTTIKDNQPQQRIAFWLAGGELDPLIKSIAEARVKLAEKRYSAVFREIGGRGREYLTEAVLAELGRWIDTLDKE
jgi:serine protease Do